MFLTGLVRGVRSGVLPRADYDPVIKKAWSGLTSTILSNGTVTGVCCGTGIQVSRSNLGSLCCTVRCLRCVRACVWGGWWVPLTVSRPRRSTEVRRDSVLLSLAARSNCQPDAHAYYIRPTFYGCSGPGGAGAILYAAVDLAKGY